MIKAALGLAAICLALCGAGASAAFKEPLLLPTKAESFGGAWFLAKVEAAGPRVIFFVRNKSNKELVEFQARIVGADAWGEDIFIAQGQWLGSLSQKKEAAILGFEASLLGQREEISPPLAAKVRIEPVFVRFADGSSTGRRAKWSLDNEEQQKLRSEMGLRLGAAKARQGAPGASAAAMLWAKPGELTGDPSSLRIAYGWRNVGAEPIDIQGAKAVFSSKEGSPLLRAEISFQQKLAPGKESFAWVGIVTPGASNRQGTALGALGQHSRVDVDGIYRVATP